MNAKSEVPASRAGMIMAIGFSALFLYACVGLFLLPPRPLTVDGENFTHWVAKDFKYASSPIDLSVINPVQGLGGLAQPLGVWLNPGHLAAHFLPFRDPRISSFLAMMLLMAAATCLLGRAVGLPPHLALVCGELMAMAVFPPAAYKMAEAGHLNLSTLYVNCSPPVAFVTILGTTLAAAFAYLGTLSRAGNIICVALVALLPAYSVLTDPLYTPMFFLPIAIFMAGIFLSSGSRPVFLWRICGGGACVLVCLAINLPGFYRALFGYAARVNFPNELYVEIQRWDYLTNLIFQHGLASLATVIVIGGSCIAAAFGQGRVRGFALSVLAFNLLMIVISIAYVYSGIRWNAPLPVYFEYAALPSYVVAAVLGPWIAYTKWRGHKASARVLAYGAVLFLPMLGIAGTGLMAVRRHSAPQPEFPSPPPGTPSPIRDILVRELALGPDGLFRGSLATIAGIPGGTIQNRRGVPTSAHYTKAEIDFVWGKYLRTFDKDFFMSGFWSLGIPTLEDNNHLVTPAFHFLVSRALSRPQDYHSRNWAVLTQANPKLMAGLGCRFLLTDTVNADPMLALRAQQTNSFGDTLYLYELQHPNLATYSPLRTVKSTNASDSLAKIDSASFPLEDAAVVYEDDLPVLTRAKSAALSFEKGGFRIRAAAGGPSLLVVPVQFSNSLRITETHGNSRNVPIRLMRVDLLETGVLFDGDIDIKIAHVFGPFRGVAGRQRDIEDARRLAIRETGEIPYPPDYQPLTWTRRH